ncbi:MAG: DMT family transporter [Cyanobacteria bacterium P01_G01_bin.19]
MNYIYILVAIFAGSIFALQPAINENVARSLNSPIQASLISFSVGTLILFVINIALGIKIPATDKLLAIPWWLWLSGGAIGAFVVTAAIMIQPKIGAGSWVACYVFGQLTMSVLMDRYGLLGLEVHPISVMRSLGVFFLVLGAILVARF